MWYFELILRRLQVRNNFCSFCFRSCSEKRALEVDTLVCLLQRIVGTCEDGKS